MSGLEIPLALAASEAAGVTGGAALAAGVAPELLSAGAISGGLGGALVDAGIAGSGGLGSGLLGMASSPKAIGMLGQGLLGQGQSHTPTMQPDVSPVVRPQQTGFMDDQKARLAKSDPYLFRIMYPQG